MQTFARLSVGVVAAAVLLVQGAGLAAAEDRVVNVFNWSDYITEEALEQFTQETGIRVNYDVYDDNGILQSRLLAGRSGYDVVFPSATPFFANQVAAGVYRELDRERIGNWFGLDPKVMRQLEVADPGNRFGVPYMSAGTAIGFNVAQVSAAMPDAPVGSWAMLLDPEVLTALEGCGVTMLDAADEAFPAALAYLGRNPASVAGDDLQAAADVLEAARPHLRYIHSSSYINDLANGAICVAHGYAGDLVQARARAREAGQGVEIGIFLPREGTPYNVDVMAIPADAPNPDAAHTFIDFLLRPEVIAAISEEIGYANAVVEAKALVSEEMRDDPVIFPPDDAVLVIPPLVDPRTERQRNRLWTRVKTQN